jgi:peptidyl-prolyl cis-trans isomerase D
MFDLFRSRDKAVRILLGALLLIVALSMLTYLVPNYSTGSDPTDQVIAEIGDQTVTVQDAQKSIQALVQGRQVPPNVLPQMIPQIVQGLITTRALEYEAQRLGFQVTDAEVADAIRQIVPSLFQDGKFVGKDAYAAMLAQRNITIEEFEADMRRQILGTRLRNVSLEASVVSPAEIEQEFKRRNEKIKVEYVKVTGDKYKAESQPSMDDQRKYYQANTARFSVPEKKNLVVLLADQAKIEQALNPTDADLQTVYNQNQDAFRTPERVKVRHILLKTAEKAPEEDAKMKAKAEDLLKQIKAGGNFAELAKKNSEDTGSATNGGELPDWVTRGQTVPEFEKAAFSLQPNQISDVIKTQYGYHIIQVLKHEQARLRPFDEVKGELATQIKKGKAAEMLQQAADHAQTALEKDPTHPDKIAAEFNMQLVRADNLAAGADVPGIGESPDLQQAIGNLKQNEVSPAVMLPNNRIAVAVVTAVVPARPATFEDVQTQIAGQIQNERMEQAMRRHAQELAEKTASMGGDLRKAAQAMGLTVKTSEEFTRIGSVEGIGSASYLEGAFAKPDGGVVGPLTMPDGQVVAKVLNHVAPDASQLASQRGAIRDDLKSRKARDRNSLFEAGVRDALIKAKKLKVHENVLNRLIQTYVSQG